MLFTLYKQTCPRPYYSGQKAGGRGGLTLILTFCRPLAYTDLGNLGHVRPCLDCPRLSFWAQERGICWPTFSSFKIEC